MKRLIILLFYSLLALNIISQTDGIHYQAVIIDPNPQEIPGIDITGNILPNADISIRFTLIDATNTEVYQETQSTTTDDYGLVNLVIGKANPDAFMQIEWDGTPKDLKVEIDFDGNTGNFVSLSREELTFVPYSYHRNITARGTLTVDDITDLNSELRVHGPANLNSSLSVNNANPTILSGDLDVDGQTKLKNTLNIEGDTKIEKNLDVGGATTIDSNLTIANSSPAHFTGKIKVADTARFEGSTEFNAPSAFTEISVTGRSNLIGPTIMEDSVRITQHFIKDDLVQINGTVRIDANRTGGHQDTIDHYAMLVEGSEQGIAIKVNGNRSVSNNYVSFWDEGTGEMWGRIEGITLSELYEDPEYITEHVVRIADIVGNSTELVSGIAELVIDNTEVAVTIADVRACVGLGACVTAPPPAKIVTKIAKVVKTIADIASVTINLGIAITEEVAFVHFSESQIGVSYQSGAGDYAEWLLKRDPGEQFIPGELVGVTNGYVSKNTFGAEKVMVVSTNPIVLGNMPPEKDRNKYEKIAFMGQVPVRVLGDVKPGDYILPNELAPGFGKAVHPDMMETRDYTKIVGVSWSVINRVTDGLSIVNVAVGINTNDLTGKVIRQEEQLNALWAEHKQLKSEIEQSNAVLASLLPGYAESIGFQETTYTEAYNPYNDKNLVEQKGVMQQDSCADCSDEKAVIIIEFSRELVEEGIETARKEYEQMYNDARQLNDLLDLAQFSSIPSASNQEDSNADIKNSIMVSMDQHPFWNRVNSNHEYKEEIVRYLKTSIENDFQKRDKSDDKVEFEIRFVGF